MATKTPGILHNLLKQLKRLAYTLTEKPSTAVEEYTLEHFLLYHGLVGSTPENQPQFRDVRADLFEAFDKNSSSNLAIALKLPPLWWEDKLQSIFAELEQQNRQTTVRLLLPSAPDAGELPPESDPLRSNFWQVRANAAAMLGFIGAEEAVPRLLACLEESRSGDLKAAFCHIASAAGRLGTSACRDALARYLYDPEPWFRVDAARALANLPFEQVGKDLALAMLGHHTLSDYMAVAIARHHSPRVFLNDSQPVCWQGALEMIIELTAASRQTFNSDVVVDAGLPELWPIIHKMAVDEPTPRAIRAALSLCQFLQECSGEAEAAMLSGNTGKALPGGNGNGQDEDASVPYGKAMKDLTGDAVKEMVVRKLTKNETAGPDDDTRHAAWLAGFLTLRPTVPVLIDLLKQKLPFADDLVEAIGLIGEPSSAQQLIAIARQTVDVEERRSRPASAQPVEELEPDAARHYWYILKALGRIADVQGMEFLLEATEDFAPDKRQQALESLILTCQRAGQGAVNEAVRAAVAAGLNDASTPVQLAALDGVARLQLVEYIDRVLKLFDAKSVSVSRKSLSVLSDLVDGGHKAAVANSVASKIRSEFERGKKERLQQFLSAL